MGGISIQAGRPMEQGQQQPNLVKQEKNTYYGGNLNLANDPIEEKRKEAQEKAWNVVKNAWDNDKSVDESIDSRRTHYAKMEEWHKESLKEVEQIENDKKALQEIYEVPEDSKEQQDLELLEKRQDYMSGVSHEALTEEEWNRLNEIDQQPLTEYQSRGLELNKRAGKFKLDMEDAKSQMQDDTGDIHSIKKERLKSNPMLDAKNQAENIMEAANQDIMGMLVQEATDHIDETLEEVEDNAEKAAEKEEEKEENLEEVQAQRAIQEALILKTKEAAQEAEEKVKNNDSPDIDMDAMLDLTKENGKAESVQSSLDDIKNSMKLLEADLKGIKVDEEV